MAQGYFVEALYDFSLAIKFEKQRVEEQAQAKEELTSTKKKPDGNSVLENNYRLAG